MDGLKIDRDGEQSWLDHLRQNDAQHMMPHGPSEYLCVDEREMGAAAVGFSVVINSVVIKGEAPQDEGDKTDIAKKYETPTPASSKDGSPEDDSESSPEITSPEIASPEITSPEIASPEITSPEITSPEIASPEITSPPEIACFFKRWPASSKDDPPEDDPESSPEIASPDMTPENTTKTDDDEEVLKQDSTCGALCGFGDSLKLADA
jgi:hypothetical protein